MIHLRRVYDASAPDGETSFLVERLWPRGMRKESLGRVTWSREVAPSDALRRWFGHQPERWLEFRRRYFAELDAKPEAWQPLVEAASTGDITLLYSARDRAHNNAVALKEYLEARLGTRAPTGPAHDAVLEGSTLSFPASDPPAWMATSV